MLSENILFVNTKCIIWNGFVRIPKEFIYISENMLMLIKGRTRSCVIYAQFAAIDKIAAMHYNQLVKLLFARCCHAENLQKMSAGYVCPLRI